MSYKVVSCQIERHIPRDPDQINEAKYLRTLIDGRYQMFFKRKTYAP